MTPPPWQNENDRDASIRPAEDALQDYMTQLFFVPEAKAAIDLSKQTGADASVDSAQARVTPTSSVADVGAERSDGTQPLSAESSDFIAHKTMLPPLGEPLRRLPDVGVWDGLNATKTDTALGPFSPLMPMPKLPLALNPQAASLISAEQVPRDVALSDAQKRDLQRLLDQKLLSSTAHQARERKTTPRGEGPIGPLPAAPREDMVEVVDPGPELLAEPGKQLEQSAPKLISDSADNSAGTQPICAAVAPEAIYRGHWQHQLPDWAATRFDVLLFCCRGVTLAIPLISLGHIYWQTEPLNQLPGAAPWGLGVKPLQKGGQLKVIDAGAFFMPERSAGLDFEAGLHMLALADSDWAFAVDRVANPVAITPEDVQWRPFSRNSPWFAGAIKRHMCVLIDTPALITLLNR